MLCSSKVQGVDVLGFLLVLLMASHCCVLLPFGLVRTSHCVRSLTSVSNLFLQVWQLSERVSINVCLHLDWKRCMAVHLWYLLPPTASISQALAMYESAFQVGQRAWVKDFTPYLPGDFCEQSSIAAEVLSMDLLLQLSQHQIPSLLVVMSFCSSSLQ